MKIDLSGRAVLITGASGQLGRAMTRTFARCGADVAIHYHRNQAQADELLAEIRAIGVNGCTVQADVADAESVMRMQRFVAGNMAEPDIIINNAVTFCDWKSVLEQAVEDYDSSYRSCVLHNVLMIKAFVPAMIAKRWGRVIAINTECVMDCAPKQSAYVSGKRGMDGLLRVLAREVGEYQITVNQVAPGWVITEREREKGISQDDDYADTVPLRRRGNDQDIANAAAFLASDLAAFITGVYLPVCGGKIMPSI